MKLKTVRPVRRWALALLLTLAGRSAVGQTLPPPRPVPQAASTAPPGLDDLVRIGLEQHPRLAQAGFAVDAAQGRAIQAGLYPNPTLQVTGDELGDRQGPGGIWTAPYVSQEIVTGGKLRLSRSAACKEVDQATLALLAQRYALLGGIRQAYFEVVALQQRVELLGGLRQTGEQSVSQTNVLLRANQASQLDVVQLEVELGRVRSEEEAAKGEFSAALRRLAAVLGVPRLPLASVSGSLDQFPLPPYDLERTQQVVLANHPEVRSASVGVERARLLLQRATVEPIPNVTVGAGYVRQNQNQSSDWAVGVSVPVPVWNRNQGNIRAAQAQLGEALQEVRRAEADLAERLATAFRDYAAARQRAERLDDVRRKAAEAFEITRQARTLTTLQRLESQRAHYQADLDYLKALADAWKAASVISGMTLEEVWPAVPPAAGQLPGR